MWARFLIVLVVVLAAGCRHDRTTTEPDPIQRPVVERLGETTVRLRWPATPAWGSVTIYAGLDPDTIERTRPLAVVSGNSVELAASDAMPWIADDYRLYYELVPASGAASVMTAERRLPLDGADNFRDLGGYRTVDGRTVRWGRLYRSNDLSALTERDQQYLARIGLRLVCDLRSERERVFRPDEVIPRAEVPGTGTLTREPMWQYLPVDQDGVDPRRLAHLIRTGGIAALGVPRVMRTAYESFVTVHSTQWSELIARIAQSDDLPALIHCTAGKDRTGFAAAVMLLALGVPEDTVYEDYLLTNHYRRSFAAFVMRWVPVYSLFRTRAEDVLPLLEARRDYLRVSYDTIIEVHGSVDAYLEDALGVTTGTREVLRANLLR